jgi:hypothetical protein
MMKEWRRSISKKDGRPHIYNSYMAVKPDARGTVQVGSLINQGQRKLMKSIPGGGTIGVTAALGVGGYNWANQGFSFDNESELHSYRQRFQLYAAEKGVHLTDEDMMKFKEPVHFAAFNDGKKYIIDLEEPMNLSQQQKDTKSLSGVEGEHKLTSAEIASGKSRRMACHLGKSFLLGRSWHGIWDSKEENTATKYADQYYQLRDRAAKFLEPEYRAVGTAAASGERVTPTRRPETTRRPSGSDGGESARLIQYFTPRVAPGMPGRSIRMTPQRISRVMRMSDDQIEHFIRNAKITRDASRRLRALMAERRRGGSGGR